MIQPDWINGLIGGLMIGCAAAVYLLVSGRVMGASGILGGVVDAANKSRLGERALFIAGLVFVPFIMVAAMGRPDILITPNVVLLVLGGVLVGFGTRIANGCTSGHGVCGISRFSVRGIVATLAYLGAGVLAMAVLRTWLGLI